VFKLLLCDVIQNIQQNIHSFSQSVSQSFSQLISQSALKDLLFKFVKIITTKAHDGNVVSDLNDYFPTGQGITPLQEVAGPHAWHSKVA